ncbi:MAG: S41 family peptidase [Bacteroidales bacterium]
MKRFITLIYSVLISTLVYSNGNTEWIRYSAISPDGSQIAFSQKGDIYLVPSSGGEAKPVTFHNAHEYAPVWSHDGKKLAFASNRHGNFDVFVLNLENGQSKRLTFFSRSEIPYTFSQDDQTILFGGARLDDAKHRGYPSSRFTELYKVSTNGGNLNQIFTITAELAQLSKDENLIIYQDKKGGEDYFRKHHTSSVTRDIWVYNKKNNKHTQLSSFKGENRNPVFAPDEKSIFYLSEESGSFNVHEMKLANPTENTQISTFSKHPVRFLSISNNGTLCYTYNGELYTQIKGDKPQKVVVSIRTGEKDNNEKVIPIHGKIEEMAISPNGKEVAYIARGEVFVSAVEGNMTKRITTTPAAESFVSFSPDGKSIIYASERDAKWGIYESRLVDKKEPYFYASTLIEEKPLIVNEHENYEPKFSPNGKEIAYIQNRRELMVYNIKEKKSRKILGSDKLFYMQDGDQYFTWSPDSKWLLVEYSPVLANTEVVLINADGKQEMINLTESGYTDANPIWVNKGKQMLWFSDRHGLRSYANSGSRQLDVYTMFFTKEAYDRFNMNEEDYKLLKEIEKKNKEDKDKDKKDKKKKKEKKDKKEEVKALTFDLDGMKDRKERLTIHSSKLYDALLSKDGETLYYLAKFDKKADLWSTNLRTKETKKLIKIGARSGSLVWNKDMKKIFLLADGKISVLDPKAKSKKGVKIQSEMTLDLKAERQQMFDHVWKRNQSMFYISNYHGADWDDLRANYEPKLASINNNFDFTELLSEMLGELNVSHCGARYRERFPMGDKTASLGVFIDYQYKDNGLKISEIIKNGPLDKKDLNIKAGMIIKKIDGKEITPEVDYAKFLNRKAGKYTLLHVFDPEKKKEYKFTVKPISLGDESDLFYERWVRQNEKEVAKLSNGKLGYVHLSGMNDGRYRNTYEKVMGKYYDKEGLIVDTRYNGGGDLVGDLTMFLTGEPFIEYAIESRPIGAEPGFRWTKPSVAMISEGNYSDGHCFACAYKDLGIGKLIGMPVPGTCSFAGWEMLQNGKVLWGSIPVSAKDKAGNWMENNETSPDIQIKNMPGKVDQGVDQQLEGAVKELLEMTKSEK